MLGATQREIRVSWVFGGRFGSRASALEWKHAGGRRHSSRTRLWAGICPIAYKHPVSITELANGDLYLVYYGGSGEYGEDTWVRGSRLVKGTDQWTRPVVIADTPFRADGNGVVWQAPDGLVWLFYVNRYGKTWSNSRIKFKVSYDEAKTWSDSDMLSFDEGSMVRSSADRTQQRRLSSAGLPRNRA